MNPDRPSGSASAACRSRIALIHEDPFIFEGSLKPFSLHVREDTGLAAHTFPCSHHRDISLGFSHRQGKAIRLRDNGRRCVSPALASKTGLASPAWNDRQPTRPVRRTLHVIGTFIPAPPGSGRQSRSASGDNRYRAYTAPLHRRASPYRFLLRSFLPYVHGADFHSLPVQEGNKM